MPALPRITDKTRQDEEWGEKLGVPRDIHLSGGDISILKVLGLRGAPVQGKTLAEHSGGMETAELVDAINGLITMGYVLSGKSRFYSMEDVERSTFRVNPSYAHDLQEAVQPGRRREQHERRRRRRS